MYINCHTYYSLRYGTLSPKELVAAATRHGIDTLVLTDINNTSCTYEFIALCKEAGIKPIIGLEFRRDNRLLFIGIAQNMEGFRELNQLLSSCSLYELPLPEIAPDFENAYVVYDRLVKPIQKFKAHEFLGVRPEHVNRLFSAEVRKYPDKLLALSPITFLNKEGYQTHKLLRAIDNNTLITKLTAKDLARRTEQFTPPAVLEKLYAPYPQLLENNKRLLETCTIDMPVGLQNNRQHFTGSIEGDFILLEKLAINGCKQRYGQPDNEYSYQAMERVKRELKVIKKQGFCPYFLITWDIVRYAKSMGYYHVGRGSGANSIVAYCLHITDVDPIELDLYFERFINPYRSSPPDFDIDFSWDERDDVTDYIFKRYGRQHTALLATYSTFKGRSIIRELGKVFGLPKAEIDMLVHEPENVERHHDLAKSIFHFGHLIEGFPNYLSIHAGGVIISEEPLNNHTALQQMPKGFPVTHFDMYHAEALGFHKFDVLSQRGLGHIKDAVELIEENKGKSIDIHQVSRIKQDAGVRHQLKSGHCIGCFYIESPAMRGLLQKLHCDNYIHLVAASSIIRPGVSKSGMMREYINRFHHPESFEYIHPVFAEHLGETFGVMVYQEDVMKIVHHFAGLDLDESDVLRRIMTGKKSRSDTFENLRRKYFENCRQRGHSKELAQEVWRQIESFSGYSFCKAHSASFAVESFQSLYLKAYYPLEFMVAVINNFGGFYHTEYYFHEARMQGGNIHAPCVNHSRYLTHLKDSDIHIGFIHLHQMERKVAHRIVHQRAKGGIFQSLEDFVDRVDINSEQLDILIRIGAFRFTGYNKYELMWQKNAVFNPQKRFENSGLLFADKAENYKLPELREGPHDQAFDEIELLGFPICSPFDLLEETPYDGIMAKQLSKNNQRIIVIYGYYVCKKEVRTVKDTRMTFGTWLDRQGHYFDTTHFPQSLTASPFRGKGLYRIEGKVVEEFGFYSIEVLRMTRLPFRKDERY
ncbi:MAG: DNA polymerase III subunit alpha [Saprospiraceae bacterium]|nr:DNA polymerase III subunit alpha [Saprospiraceae bacterium]